MIVFSKFGKKEIQRHSLMPLVNAKLYVGEGEELTGHGYAPIFLDINKWELSTGTYPKLEWLFEADIPADVKGWFVTNGSNDIILHETFDEPQTVQHTGDKISIVVTFSPVVKNNVNNS